MKYDFTYKAFSTYWLDNAVKNHLSDSTYKSYCTKINHYINPYIGEMPLASIKKMDVQDNIYQLQQQTALSSNSIRTVHTILNKSLKYAVDMELIGKNPATGIQLPAAVKYMPMMISPTDLDKMIVLSIGTDLEIPVLLASRMGLRRGEILALQWKDVDFQNKALFITKSLSQSNVLTVPKGSNATRILYIPDDVYKVLQHQSEGAYEGNTYIVHGKDGSPHAPSWLSSSFARFIDKNGLPKIRFHDLRHQFAFNAHYNGMPVKQLSQILGHSTAAISLDYYVADI